MDFVGYIVWVFFCLFACVVIDAFEKRKSEEEVVKDFLEYVKKGRRRVARLTKHVYFFLFLQVLYIFFLNVNFFVYLAISFVVFYLYALLFSENVKKHRCKGIAIGYEYPHPVTFKKPLISYGEEKEQQREVVYAGSKGIYDLQIKSEPNPHAIIVGESGYGKTTTLHAFIVRNYLQNFIPFLLIDPSKSYEKEVLANVWRVPINLKLNPFKLNGLSKERRAAITAELFKDSFDLTELQANRLRNVLEEFYFKGIEPTPKDIKKKLLEMLAQESSEEMRNSIRFTIEKINEGEKVFGNEPKEFWDNVEKTCNVIDISDLTDGDKKLVTYLIFQRIIEKFEKESEEEKIKLYIAIDDAYQLLEKIKTRETNITKVVREGRKYGFGVIIATQMVEDIPKPIVSNSSVKILHYCKSREIEEFKRIYRFTQLEERIFQRLKPGFAFIIDENAIHYGKVYPAFVEIDKLTNDEIKRFSEVVKRINIAGYEIEVPKEEKEELEEIKVEKPIKLEEKRKFEVEIGVKIPEVALYRFLVALYKTKNVSEALKFLKEKKLVTSKATLYGSSIRIPLFKKAIQEGYAKENGELTAKALAIVSPSLMVMNQGARAGGEVHRALMKKIIEIEQERGNFAFVPKERESFDVGVLVPSKKKGVWENKVVRAYEVQTTAKALEIEQCIRRQREGKYELIFVTNSKKVKKEIQKLVGNTFKVIVLKPFE